MTRNKLLLAGGALLLLAAIQFPGTGPNAPSSGIEAVRTALHADAAPSETRASLAAALTNFAQRLREDADRQPPSWPWTSALANELAKATDGLGETLPQTSQSLGRFISARYGLTGPDAKPATAAMKRDLAEQLDRIAALGD